MRRHLAYGWYVLRHKWFVFLAAYRLGVPWLGLIHDWSKLTPGEWFPYAQTFYTPQGIHQYVESEAFQRAWNHHQKANKHHWQYWIPHNKEPLMIPEKYVKEMLCDWTTMGNVKNWYEENKEHITLHPLTKFRVKLLLDNLSEEFEKDIK